MRDVAFEGNRVLRDRVHHVVRPHLHFAFLARDARLGVDHDFELGVIFRPKTRIVGLELLGHDIAVHVLLPDVVREAFRLVQVNLVVQAMAVVAVLAFCAMLIARGWMDSTGLVLFCSALLLCYKPVKECARAVPQFRAAASACDVLEEFEGLPKRAAGNSTSEIKSAAFIYFNKIVSIAERKFKVII